MVEYKLHKNGWTVFIQNFDLKNATQEDINEIAKLIATYTCVVIRGQNLNIEDELRVLRMFKDPKPLHTPTDVQFLDLAADIEKDPTGILCRITGELRDGKPGGAGWNEELMWHCNEPDSETRCPIVWLYAVRGSSGSVTSWNNTILAYADLDDNIKKQINDLHSIYGNIGEPKAAGFNGVQYNDTWTPPLVHKNIANQLGMYFTPLQLQSFVELSQEESDKLRDILFEHVVKEKYVYHHEWQDGDVVLSEQWLGIHKRWPFNGMNKRVLHRAAVHFPEQDYTN